MEEEPGVQVWLPCANGVMFPQFLSLVGHGSQCLLDCESEDGIYLQVGLSAERPAQDAG